MSAMLAMSFDELRADVQRREAFDQYKCIWKTGNNRCQSVLTDENSLATIRSILASPKLRLDEREIQRAGHLSLCSDHGDVISRGELFNNYWMYEVASDSDFSGPQTPFQHDPRSAGEAAPPGDVPTRQLHTSPPPPTGSSKLSRPPYEIVTVSESAVARLADSPSPNVTHLPQHGRLSRPSCAVTTPTRNTRRVVSTPTLQPAVSGTRFPTTSPSHLASASGRKATYSYPCFSALQADFQNSDLKEYRCLAKRALGGART
jgi:hypothetical protein